jgi:hypothetical protein
MILLRSKAILVYIDIMCKYPIIHANRIKSKLSQFFLRIIYKLAHYDEYFRKLKFGSAGNEQISKLL